MNFSVQWSKEDILRSTLYRRMKELDILHNLPFSQLSDQNLDEHIREIKLEHPNDGEVLLRGMMCTV